MREDSDAALSLLFNPELRAIILQHVKAQEELDNSFKQLGIEKKVNYSNLSEVMGVLVDDSGSFGKENFCNDPSRKQMVESMLGTSFFPNEKTEVQIDKFNYTYYPDTPESTHYSPGLITRAFCQASLVTNELTSPQDKARRSACRSFTFPAAAPAK